VIDNGSTDGSMEGLDVEFPEIRIVQLDWNVGCTGGRNIGIQYSTGDFIFFLDNDGVLDSNALERSYHAIQQSAKIAVVTGKVVLRSNNQSYVPSRIGQKHADKSFLVPTFAGGASLHRRCIFKEVGLFQQDYIYGGEEHEFALRLAEKSYFIWYESSVVMYHNKSKLSRDNGWNFARSSSNLLVSAWRLYPLEIAIMFTVRFIFVRPVRAIQNGTLVPLILNTLQCMKRVWKTIIHDRTPVKRETMRTFHHLHATLITSVEGLLCAEKKLNRYSMKDFLHLLLFFR